MLYNEIRANFGVLKKLLRTKPVLSERQVPPCCKRHVLLLLLHFCVMVCKKEEIFSSDKKHGNERKTT